MNEHSYRDHVALVRRAAKANCKQSKTNAVEEVKTVYEPKEEVKFDIEVSGDDTIKEERRHSSSYGVVTALSTITDNEVDVEVMSTKCKEFFTVWSGTQEFQA